ncbi:J domain-containing protein CG6693-like [Teleopsis dalmanni]|uniref:J domain-containing protein CG6693-like n=1 Tax=Teleopsis dalmanni TaxID=139649 RepID=UPI0018CCDB74|nr:J domain-containing protein CG6693-like [Teleopsis dalmanni]XP_037946343.1 J domain-containing protein CG6693-like [Teleopsis dalmanni]
MSTLELCEKLFGTRDIYKLFDIPKTATDNQIKKAYYKLSLKVHPDRVANNEKETATEKFKLLSKLYQVLTDSGKRALYDERNMIDDDDVESKLSNWLDLWKSIFKPITEEDIVNYENSYVGSDLEKSDIKKAYLAGKGSIDHIMNAVPFFKVEDEPRLKEIVMEMINADEVPEYDVFVNEPESKRKKRHNKYARESKEAEKIKKKMKAKDDNLNTSSLEKQIMLRQKSRVENFDSLMDKLMEKYGGDDDSEVLDFSERKKTKTPKSKKSRQSKGTIEGKVKKRRQ